TPPGTPVEISLRQLDGKAVLKVVDHGAGLPPGVGERVFEPFFRADTARSRDRGGAGLGLSIVAAVVAAHGGTVGVENTLGGGATFTVQLPASPPPLPAEAPLTPTPPPPTPSHPPCRPPAPSW